MPLDTVVDLMAQALLHRRKQCYYVEDSDIRFVSNREAEASPDLLLVYSGQFFNLKELRAQLFMHEDSECETVLKTAYRKWGCNFIVHLEGEFTVALYDKINKRLFLSRDRAGMKPLYYSYDGALLIFASEVQALLRTRKKRMINFASLHAAIVLGSVYSNEHLIEGVYELRAGHNLILDFPSKSPTIQKYWDRLFNIVQRPFTDYEKEIKCLLNEAVKKRLPLPGTKVGVASSGGFDSTLVLSLIKESYPGPIETYTVIAEGDEFSEYQEARLVAKHFQIKHHELVVSAYEAVQNLPKIIWHMSEFTTPYYWVAIPLQTYFAGKLAKENGCDLLFTGNGEEHNFDGNGSQRILNKFYHHSKKMPKFIRDGLVPFLPPRLKNILRTYCSYFWTTEEINNIEKCYVRQNSWGRAGEEPFLKEFYTEDFARSIASSSVQKIFIEYLKGCTAQDYFNKLLYLDFKTWNSRRNLVTNERLFGAFGIKLEIPFLDVDLVQYSSSMPIAVKHSFTDSKYFLRKIYKNTRNLPKEIFNKGKCHSWLRFDFSKGPVFRAIAHFVNRLKKRGVFKENFIDRVLSQTNGDSKQGRDQSYLIGLFGLELWFRIFIDYPDIKEEDLTLDYLGRY